MPAAQSPEPAGDPFNSVLHIWQQENTPLPTYGIPVKASKSGLCVINGNCLTEEHMIK